MSNWTGFVLTENGQRMLAKAEAGKTLTFTKIKLGDGQVASGQDLTKLTALAHAVQDVGISSITPKDDGTVVISGIISNATLDKGYYIREFGLMASDPDVGEILYAVMMDTAPDFLPPKTSPSVISEQYNIIMGVGNASSVNVIVDPAGLATMALLEQKFSEEKAEREKETTIVTSWMSEAFNLIRLVDEKAKALKGFVVEADLTNTQAYPFNNSVKTIALTGEMIRLTKDYTVIVEAAPTGGHLGDVLVSDKMLNGFKVAYTGSATSAHVKCYVQGGM